MRVRPVVRCLIAFPTSAGGQDIARTIHLVDLQEAEWRRREGWMVVGPDPDDVIALALWEREQGG